MNSDIFSVYDLVVGLLTTFGLAYLVYLDWDLVTYRRSLVVVAGGIVVFSVASPAAELLAPEWRHVVHGMAALLVLVGLYVPLHRVLLDGGSLTMLVTDPTSLRLPPSWMSPMDEDILELFHSSDLVLTPAIIAFNLDYSREEVNRHLTELESHGIVARVARGKYRITSAGERYLNGGRAERVASSGRERTPADENPNL